MKAKKQTPYQRACRYARTHEHDDIHTPWSALRDGYEAGYKAGFKILARKLTTKKIYK